MSCKAALYTANTTGQTITPVASGTIVPVGVTVRRFGNNSACCKPYIDSDGTTITLRGRGYYEVSVSATVTPTAAGATTFRLFKDGVVVPGANATTQTTAAGQVANVSFTCLVRETCCDEPASLAIVANGGTFSLSNMAVVTEKL